MNVMMVMSSHLWGPGGWRLGQIDQNDLGPWLTFEQSAELSPWLQAAW